ncbi:MAG: NAD-dependent epimerase/dehydratase family protein [Ignavibacteriaceae bacterium]|nr:NAD-dependent epimerase/dehydratase family protein [Ignavibacteriaceae bacterium]
MAQVLITGASGLIGSHIAEYFSGEGIDVTALARRESNTDFLKSIGVKIIYGDITDTEMLYDLFDGGYDFVIHTAAKVSDLGEYDDFYLTNVTGTLNVLKAAHKNNIENVIVTGSISCFGEEHSEKIKDETSGYNPHYPYFLDKIFPSPFNYYRDSKVEACIKAIEFAEAYSLSLAVIHPGWVYGEREFHSGFYDYLMTVKSGIPAVPGSRRNKFHSVYARDLARMYYEIFRMKPSGINEYLAVSPVAEYQYRLLDKLCEKAGLRIPFRLPKWFIYPPALITELIYALFRINSAPPISRSRVNIFYDNIEYSAEKLIKETGFRLAYTFEESVENTIKWYKTNNYL